MEKLRLKGFPLKSLPSLLLFDAFIIDAVRTQHF